MRHQYEPVMGGTGDAAQRPSSALRPGSARTTRRKRLPSCSSQVAVMEASTGPHRNAGPFGAATGTGVGPHFPQRARVVKGVAPPKWANANRFEPALGGTNSGRRSKLQAYKENRLASGGYFPGTVGGPRLVAKSSGVEPLSAAEAMGKQSTAAAAAARSSPKRQSSVAAAKKKLAFANRPGWQRPTSVRGAGARRPRSGPHS